MTRWEWEFVNETLLKYGYAPPMLDLGGIADCAFADYDAGGLAVVVGGHIWHGIDDCDISHDAETYAATRTLRYGTIVSTSTLEHTANPFTFMKAAAELLTVGGLLALTVPFFWDEHGDWQDDHWRFTRGGLVCVAKHAGLNVIEVGVHEFSAIRKMTFLIASRGPLGERPQSISIPEVKPYQMVET